MSRPLKKASKKKTSKTRKAVSTLPKQLRNRAAQDLTLINLHSLKRRVKILEEEQVILRHANATTNARIDDVIQAGQKLEQMVFPLQRGSSPIVRPSLEEIAEAGRRDERAGSMSTDKTPKAML